jgi:hypothetical protein
MRTFAVPAYVDRVLVRKACGFWCPLALSSFAWKLLELKVALEPLQEMRRLLLAARQLK